MTTLVPPRVGRRTPVRPGLATLPVVALALLTMAARLPFVGQPLAADEAGFLVVGSQWHAGSSLYGNYWVDRPPLLVTLFDLAAHLGGAVPLRLLGCVAAGLVVLGVGQVARQVGGPRAAGWAAALAAALCVSPLAGSLEVDGELLAAPFVVWGVAAALAAVRHRRTTAGRLAGLAAGAAGVVAVLVKQNEADVAVLAVLLLLVGVVRRELPLHEAATVLGRVVLGGLGALVVAALWTRAHGTSLSGVYDAMYPFRIAAGRVLAATSNPHPTARLVQLVAASAASGMLLAAGLVGWALLARRRTAINGTIGGTIGGTTWALAGLLVFDVASLAAGGNYWLHYLVQPLVPLSVLTGVVASRAGHPSERLARWAVALAGVSAAVALAVGGPALGASSGTALGRAVGRVAAPGDTIVTLYGNAEVTRASGLDSPYPYLWSLPVRVRDPRLDQLDALLTGDRAPSWLVVTGSLAPRGVDDSSVALAVRERYRPVVVRHGHTVYLRDDLRRSTPHP